MAEDKSLKKPFTDEQRDFLMDYLFNKFIEDMKRDEMRREDPYNQPPKTDPEGKPILSANMGGMISIDQLTSPLMMSSGGDANVKLLEKIGKVGKDTSKLKVPTTRLTDNFRNTLLESGFDKKATVKDVKAGYATKTGQKIGSFTAFNNYLGKINPNLTVFSNDPKTMVKVTNELNKVRSNLGLPKYTNVGITTPRSKFEQIQTKTGYAEAGSKIPKEKVQKVTLEAQLKADKEFGVTPDGKTPTKKKLNFMAKYIQSKLGKTLTLSSIMTFLTKSGFGKTIPGLDLFIPSPMGSGELPEKGTPEYEQLMQDMGKNQGGMMDINYMTRPLGYKEGTRDGELVGDQEKTQVGAIDTLRSLAASEVYNSMMNKEGVNSSKIASAFLRDQGIATNDQSMGAIINLLDSQIIPQEQLKLMKEGQSTLGKGMDMGARGIEGLLDMLGISDSRKFRDMDRNILKELKDMRTN
jgi:hypothetical protein|tara:strand:- start:220 stop:1617 length:1398 start_codon:yes stop_codon:yes gene_type:complete